jgi:hypothetical protein
MTFESNKFDMGMVMNKLRSIAENGAEQLDELDPGMETGGKEIDTSSFTRTMSRLQAIKDAVDEDHYNALRAGVRSLYMNRRPNLQQMTALMDLLETVLAYVAEDNSLFQRLKTDLAKDQTAEPGAEAGAEVGAPKTAEPQPQSAPAPEMRGMKS